MRGVRTMKNDKLEKAIYRVYEDLSNLPDEEFQQELEKHEDGDIANILLYTNALDVGEIESEFFAGYSEYYPKEKKSFIPSKENYEFVPHFNISERFLTATSFAAEIADSSLALNNVFAKNHPFENIWQNKLNNFGICIPSQISLFESSLIDIYSSTVMQSYFEVGNLFAHSIDIPGTKSDQNKIYSIDDKEEYELAA